MLVAFLDDCCINCEARREDLILSRVDRERFYLLDVVRHERWLACVTLDHTGGVFALWPSGRVCVLTSCAQSPILKFIRSC